MDDSAHTQPSYVVFLNVQVLVLFYSSSKAFHWAIHKYSASFHCYADDKQLLKIQGIMWTAVAFQPLI